MAAAALSLRARTIYLASLGVGSLLLADAALQFNARREEGRAALTERASLLADMQAEALSVPLWNLDDEQVRAAVDAFARDPDFGSSSITRADGTVIQAKAAPPARAGAPETMIEVERPIRHADHGQARIVGRLRLCLRTDRLDRALATEAWQRAAILAALLGAVLAIVLRGFAEITRPLDLLAGALSRLAAGDRQTPIPALNRTDEIGAVARGLEVFRETAFRLMQTESEYRAVFDNAALGIFRMDTAGHIISANAAFLALSGHLTIESLVASVEDASDRGFFVSPDRRGTLHAKRAENDGFIGETSEIRRADGVIRWITATSRALRDESGRLLGHVATVEDITERRRRDNDERLRIRAAVESAGDAILIADPGGTPLFVNSAFTDMLGYDLASITAVGGMSHVLQVSGVRTRDARGAQAETATTRLDADLRTADGRFVPMAVRISAIRDESGGATVGTVTICTDLTDQRSAAARIWHMAHHDGITGLANRTLFQVALEGALESVRRADEQVGVLCIDLDRFKDVNDTLGHAAGDVLLQAVAERIRRACRETDTVARTGGDEFVVIQRQLSQPDGAETLARRLVAELGAPYDIGGQEAIIGASIGISVAPDDSLEGEVLLRFGDLALYEAKAAGRGTARRFRPEMDVLQQSRSAIERDLRRALAEDALTLHFQPQIDLATGRLIGAEALSRWTHPERGMVSPVEFIPIAEQTGLILPLGAWALRAACREAATWPEHLRIAVNLSPVQFRGGSGLLKLVCATLADTELAPERLEFEITEGVMLRDTDATLGILKSLKALGCRISLDDFGTGYSSLSYLRRMPIDKIKIDQSFVRALDEETSALALVRSIIAIASGLGITTTAEGIETEAQAARLREEGCNEGQGWLFGRPAPGEVFAAGIAQEAARWKVRERSKQAVLF